MQTNCTIGKHSASLGDYCGITAMMLLTGLYREPLKALINAQRGRRPTAPVLGTSYREIRQVLKDIGLTPMGLCLDKKRKLSDLPKSSVGIVHIANHWVAYHEGWVADTHEWSWREVELSKWKNRRVKVFWMIKG